MNTPDPDLQRELAEIEAESIGWMPLESSAYLHVSDENSTEVLVVGVPQAGDAVFGGLNQARMNDSCSSSTSGVVLRRSTTPIPHPPFKSLQTVPHTTSAAVLLQMITLNQLAEVLLEGITAGSS